jgi:hypothetical protein
VSLRQHQKSDLHIQAITTARNWERRTLRTMKVDSIQAPLASRPPMKPEKPDVPQTAAVDGRADAAGPDTIAPRGPHPQDLGTIATQLRQSGDGAGAAVSNTVKGTKAGDLTPQRYELRSIPRTNPHNGNRNSSVAGIFDTAAGKVNPTTGAPRGAFAVRFDQPHVGPGGNQLGHHLNYGTLPADPHVAVPSQLVKAVGTATRVLETAERVAGPVTAAIDAARLGSAFAQDGGQIGAQTIQTAGSVVGGWAGGLAGAEAGGAAGAAGGAALGALVAGVGAVPGAAIGGVVGSLAGGIAGALGGSWLGAHASDTIVGRP